MRVTASMVQNGCLRITCAGPFGVGSEGNPSGERLRHALETALEELAAPISQVVVDFSEVDYEWGDGPAWSVLPAIRRGLKVTYLAQGRTREALIRLFEATQFDRLGEITVLEAA